MAIEIVSFQKKADSYKVQVSHSRFMCDLDGVHMSKKNLIKTLEANPQAIWIDQDKTFWSDLVNSFGMPEIQGLNELKPSSLEPIDLTFPGSLTFVAKPCFEDVRCQIVLATIYHDNDQAPMRELDPHMQYYSIIWISSEKCNLRNGCTWEDAMILRGSEINKLSIPGIIIC